MLKRNEIVSFVATWMDLEGIILSEISQIEKDTNLQGEVPKHYLKMSMMWSTAVKTDTYVKPVSNPEYFFSFKGNCI